MNATIGRIRAAWQTAIGLGSVDATAETARICAVLKADAAFCAAFLDDALCRTVYEVGIGELSAGRGDVATRIATAAEVAETIARGTRGKGGAWERWLERDPATGAYLRLIEMTRPQLLAAAGRRDEVAAIQRVRADFSRALAGRLAPGQRVRDAWNAAEMDDLYARIAGACDDNGRREVA